jgi:altronate dehydratase large subunit
MSEKVEIKGYLRSDGRKGIRNIIVVAYLVECAHHVAREIAYPYRAEEVHLIGFRGCFPNEYAFNMMKQLCTHPNVGAVLLVSLGCESFDRVELQSAINASQRPLETLVIQQQGGSVKSIEEGRSWVEKTMDVIDNARQVRMGVDELIVGTTCGGSDATSGITANPATGKCFDFLVQQHATAIFEEGGELIGCEQIMADRAATPEVAQEILKVMEKTARYYTIMGHGSFSPGNAEGGLSTQEEKSMGAYSKSGDSPISGIIKPGEVPSHGGLYFLDIVPEGEVRFGFPNDNDTAEIAELIACGSHLILFTTGRGSVVGSAISPVIKICANPETYHRMQGDMDIDAGRILDKRATLDEVGEEIIEKVVSTANGERTVSEALGHQEFILDYKTIKPARPDCSQV